jgi:hypothetical protein
MSEESIIQNLISQLGQSQDGRVPRELQAHFVDVDERTPRDLLLFTRKLARFVNYYRDDAVTPQGNWESFFPYDETSAARLLAEPDGATPPHLALLVAFLKLYELPRAVLNQLPARHLDFYYQRVLGFGRRAPVPDRAHLLIELKKDAAPVRILPEHGFSAGKDATGVERVYAPTRETVIGPARIDSLRSIFLDSAAGGTVRCAPIANSSDGVGGELQGGEPKWRAFGHPGLPRAEVGFAVASPVLRMAEGHRKVKLLLQLENPSGVQGLGGSFEAFITGEKGWLRPEGLTAKLSKDNLLRLDMEIPAAEKAIVDYNVAIHGYAYAAQAPVLQVLHIAGGAGYDDLKTLTVRGVHVSVEVTGVSSLALESDAGTLDPKKAFLPFGPQPAAGSRFMIGTKEALSKKLSEITLDIQWQGVPANLATHHANYGVTVNDAYFTFAAAFRDGGGRDFSVQGRRLFDPGTAASQLRFTFGGSPAPVLRSSTVRDVHALLAADGEWARRAAFKTILAQPVLAGSKPAGPEARGGFVTLTLEKDFLHATYRQKTIENLMIFAKSPPTSPPTGPVILKEPYTPAIRSIELSYKAQSDQVDIGSGQLRDFTNADVQFFHAGCFGRMREHGYQRRQFGFVTDKRVPLLPTYENQGELLLGVSGLRGGDGVSVLFQVAEGSADPDLKRQPVQWSVLCDNYWKNLGSGEVTLDTTNQLLTSGIVAFVIPPEATVNNTILPAGRIWLKAAVRNHVDAVCQLIDVAANAIEVEFRDQANDPAHFAAPLPAGKITRLKTPIAAVKKMMQPYASFGGRAAESVEALNMRAAERLRHKNRCVTPWDYERSVLAAFPGIHKAKCIPHAKDGSWLAPGHVLMVVVPDLRNKNAKDSLRPKVDADTLSRIAAHLQARAGMQTTIKVKNPDYQVIHLDFRVRLRPGYDFNFYSKLLNEELVRFLSPWAFEGERDISFGGRIYKSVLLDFVDQRPYVDYVTDFRMSSAVQGISGGQDVNEVRAQRPDAILVSAAAHAIGEAF